MAKALLEVGTTLQFDCSCIRTVIINLIDIYSHVAEVLLRTKNKRTKNRLEVLR